VAELVAEDNRVALGRSLTDVVHGADERLLPTATPLARAAVRECRPELLALAARLFEVEQPVTARGVLLVEQLVVDGSGPMYGTCDARRLRAAARRARAVLEGTE
jgi:hypothetical protein